MAEGAPGVGSNRTQPAEPIQSSGQACASTPRTIHWLPSWRPWVNPTTTRDGIPTERAIPLGPQQAGLARSLDAQLKERLMENERRLP